MVFYEPLDLQHLFINILSGNTIIFTFIAIIAIVMAAAYFKMANGVTLTMLAIFLIIMSPWIGLWAIIPMIIITGVLIYWTFSKLWE